MSEHTPGPWGIKKTNDGSTAVFSGETGNWVAAVFKSTPIEQQANARLIASAPDLLEALKKIADEDCSGQMIYFKNEDGSFTPSGREKGKFGKIAQDAIDNLGLRHETNP